MALTREFFAQARVIHELFISPLVLEEISGTREDDRRRELMTLIEEAGPEVLEWTADVGTFADRVLQMGALTERSRADALHIAFAVVHGMDALVTWNMADLTKLKTKRTVAALCRLLGYKELELVTPEQV